MNASTDVPQDTSTRQRIQIREIPALVETRLPKSLWPFAGVILLYIVAIFIIPTGAPVGISDDWTYYLSVDNLVTHGRFDILSVSAATMVFQLFWGGLFGFIFGMSFGVLRMSTIVITLLRRIGRVRHGSRAGRPPRARRRWAWPSISSIRSSSPSPIRS